MMAFPPFGNPCSVSLFLEQHTQHQRDRISKSYLHLKKKKPQQYSQEMSEFRDKFELSHP